MSGGDWLDPNAVGRPCHQCGAVRPCLLLPDPVALGGHQVGRRGCTARLEVAGDAAVLAEVRELSKGWAAEVARRIDGPARQIIAEELRNAPHYPALKPGGHLAKLFGLGRGKPRPGGAHPTEPQPDHADAVVESVTGEVRVEVVPPAGDQLAGVMVTILVPDYERKLAVPGNDTWLKWLLLEGQTSVVASVFGGDPRRTVRVPQEYAGDLTGGNWLTQAAGRAAAAIQDLLERTYQAVAGR